MKLVFVHDGPLFESGGNYYEYAYHNLYERYSYIADEITFLTRVAPIGTNGGLTLVPQAVKVTGVPNTKSPKALIQNSMAANHIIEKCVADNDIFILRLQSMIAEKALKYILKAEKPFICEVVGCAWDAYWNHSALGKLVAPVEYARVRNAVHRSDYVYYVTTEFLQSRYPAKPDARTVCCSNVVLDDLDDSALLRRLKKLETQPTGGRPLVIGTAAALDTRYKGQEYVIRAIPMLRELGIDVEYRLAGGRNRNPRDHYLADVAEECGVSDKVKFIGTLSKGEMRGFYEGLDVYAQPSKQEGLPRSVIESMATGCPCIGTNIAGIPELIQGDLLFEKGSAKGVVSAVQRLLMTDLAEVARRNYRISTLYAHDILDARRKEFYDMFIEERLGRVSAAKGRTGA